MGDDGTRGHHRPASHDDGSDADDAGSQRGAILDPCSDRGPVPGGFWSAVACHGSWCAVVGQDDPGADEHAVANDGGFIDHRAILDLTVAPDPGAGADVHKLTEAGAGANLSVLTDMGSTPDHRTVSNAATGINTCFRINCRHVHRLWSLNLAGPRQGLVQLSKVVVIRE